MEPTTAYTKSQVEAAHLAHCVDVDGAALDLVIKNGDGSVNEAVTRTVNAKLRAKVEEGRLILENAALKIGDVVSFSATVPEDHIIAWSREDSDAAGVVVCREVWLEFKEAA